MDTAVNDLSGVSCPTTLVCFAAGSDYFTSPAGSIETTTDGGQTWTVDTVPSGEGGLEAISCPSIDACYAVGQDQDVETDDAGATWTTDGVPAVTVGLSSVSCPAIAKGVAVGEGHAPFGGIIVTGPAATHSA